MRWLLVLLVFAGPARAVDRDAVEALVERLASPRYLERQQAFLELQRLGDEALPILAELDPPDPEARRYLHALLRKTRSLRLQILKAPAALPIGSALVLEVELRNETEDSYIVPFSRRPPRGGGTWSIFSVVAGEKERYLSPDEVEILTEVDRWIILEPGRRLRVALTMEGQRSPLRRPGVIHVTVALSTDNLVKRYGPLGRPEEMHQETTSVRLKAEAVPVHAVGRKPAELEAALAGDAKARAGAVAELVLREDGAVLPLLRRHVEDRDLRLAAVRRLGRAAHARDLERILEATGDRDEKVRRAAVAALGRYPQRRARNRLMRLLDDALLELEAARALRHHKHRATVARFIEKLEKAWRDPAVVKEIQSILYDWTGVYVSNNSREIQAFARWWRTRGRFKDDT